MQLGDLLNYESITIQCHDNPDGDAIGSGYALYQFFKDKKRNVRLIYSGRMQIQKSNLVLMVEKLKIPIQYIPMITEKEDVAAFIKGLLITVDCQYGAGNVTRFPAEEVAIIDHHQIEINNVALSEIQSCLGSCATLVWKLMKAEGFNFKADKNIGTALYYGLFTDTNQLAEIHNPIDMDMRDDVSYDKSLITLFKNSNLSLKELEIAGIALIHYILNDDYHYAIVKAQPCDPNVLGVISDLLLQVDAISACIVYNKVNDGYKISVRSCCKEIRASELAAYITKDIGSGGGHYEKAGGFISEKNYEMYYKDLDSEAYFEKKMNEYFDNTDIIYAKEYDMDYTDMKLYSKKKELLGYVVPEKVLPIGTPITIRTLEGDIDITVDTDFYIMLGIKGEAYQIKKEKFLKTYRKAAEPFIIETEYSPTIRNRNDGSTSNIMNFTETCVARGDTYVYAKELTKSVKVFTVWDEEKYLSGGPGDYIAVRCDDGHDIYVVERDIFSKNYCESGAVLRAAAGKSDLSAAKGGR